MDILSWSRSKGLYAGASLTGENIQNDMSTNLGLFGKRFTDKHIVMTNTQPPTDVRTLDAVLNRFSPREAPNTPLATQAASAIAGDSNSADRSATPAKK